MKILHVIPTYKPAYVYGGPVISVSKLCEALAAIDGIDVHMLTTNGNGESLLDVPHGQTIKVDGVPTTYFRRVMGDPHEASPALWSYLYHHAREYDVLHVHSWWNLLAMVAALLGTQRHAKVILSPRGMLSDYTMHARNPELKKWAHRLGGRNILSQTYFHATSDQEVAECQTLIPGWRGYSIPNIIGLPLFQPSGPVTDKPTFTLGFLSRLDPKKGLELLLEAVCDLPFPFRLEIAGSGDERYVRKLKAMVADLGLQDKVDWMGWLGQEEKFRVLGLFDMLVLPSHNENFANVVIEALHMGTPVCISREVGLSGWVEAEGLGWITDRTVSSLRHQIIRAHEDKQRLAWVRKHARRIVREHFSEEVLIRRYVSMYEAVSGLNGGRSMFSGMPVQHDATTWGQGSAPGLR
jgi:glycosyltransferase involved in cell wall biosynthesis